MTTFAFPASLTTQDGTSTIVAFNATDEQPVKTADSFHPHFEAIVQGLKDGDPEVWDLFDVVGGVMKKLHKVTDRFSWSGAEVLYDGDPLHNTLADQMSRAIKEGLPHATVVALGRFYENLQANPVEHSREQAYAFLAAHQFQITAEGNVVGFKGVYDQKDGTYLSWHASEARGLPSAYVNNVPLPELQRVKQSIGDTVSMPRSEVIHNPNQHCARGLHVATQDYAKGYGDTVMEVEFNPAKLVSVPDGAGGQKVRVHEYKVRRIAAGAYGTETVLVEGAASVGYEDVGTRV